MSVSHVRKELQAITPIYTLIRDAIAGQFAVKAALTKYLPQPNSMDTSAENLARYMAYVERAVFYNVTGRTLRGMAGQVFMRPPVVELPTALQTVNDDANGEGVSLEHAAKRTLLQVLAYGRAG